MGEERREEEEEKKSFYVDFDLSLCVGSPLTNKAFIESHFPIL